MDLTLQQQEFLAFYTDPNSPTFGNALQSGLRAKYSREYSESITVKGLEWLSDNVGKSKRLKKAERNLEEVQNLRIVDDEGKTIAENLRERNKVDMFFAETIGKKDYSKRNELSGPNGEPLQVTMVSFEEYDKANNNSVQPENRQEQG